MFDNGNERAGIEERYETACNTSNLRVEAESRGSADVFIAAGWSPSRIGMALLRLHSEWNALAKPRRVGKEVLEVIGARIKAQDVLDRQTAQRNGQEYETPKATASRAQAEADRWYVSELRLLANGLKSRAVIWEQLGPWIAQKGIDPDLAAEALLHWLDPTCRACDGLALRKVAGQPALSARQCNKCHGTGHTTHPHGSARLLAHLDYCVGVARGSLKKRLRPE